MDAVFELIACTRKNFLQTVEALSLEQLNIIPEGYNNNIAWNFGHIIVSQQILAYVKAGLPALLEENVLKKYQRGSFPEKPINEEELAYLKTLLFSLPEIWKADIKKEIFSGYQPFTTHFGVTLNSVEEAVPFVATHDNLHLGYVKALLKNVK